MASFVFRPDRLRAARDSAGLSRYRVGLASGINPDTLRSWEEGRIREPGAEKLAAIADALGVPLESLLEPEPVAS